jgi:hypothetical protein
MYLYVYISSWDMQYIYIYIYIYSKDMTNEKNEFYYVLINDFTVLILSAISFM